MSVLESAIWHVLGYAAIPVILLTGIALSSLVFFLLVELAGGGSDEE